MPRAIQIREFGGPEVMKLVDVQPGDPGPGEVRIRHEACGVNYIDVYHRTGLYPNKLPLELGMEGAGVVEAVGDGVVRLPDGIAFDTGAAMMLKGLTAQYLLRKTLPQDGLHAGDFVLWHAAAGGVGLIACQWARALGLRLIATAGSDAKCALAL